MNIKEGIEKRFSVRAFTDEVPKLETIKEILKTANAAPSGGNIQPWKVYVLNIEIMENLEKTVLDNIDNGVSEKPNFNIYPQPMSDHLKERVKECGKLMYGALDIDKDDIEGRLDQLKRNFSFFGAPIGMIITVEKEVDLNGWGHVGHFIQNICLASMEFGLGTCLQESWSMYPETAQKIVNFSESEILWCGIALGYPNFEDAINTYRTPRENLKDFAKFL